MYSHLSLDGVYVRMCWGHLLSLAQTLPCADTALHAPSPCEKDIVRNDLCALAVCLALTDCR